MAFGKKIKEMISDEDSNEESYYTDNTNQAVRWYAL